ncbi:MAG: hypothetical protein IT168_10825 [Bryobacterales bacterium]|nr:hypothetical protein [Bryobacterales bacterium]
MTGQIKSLSAGNTEGMIKAENGVMVRFSASDVLAYDVNSLAVGQLVTFETDGPNGRIAFNVCILTKDQDIGAHLKQPPPARLRYVGFEHRGNARAYRFETAGSGMKRAACHVSIEMAQLARYRLTMQDGPAVCLHSLSSKSETSETLPTTYTITEADMQAFMATRPAPKAARVKPPKRTPRDPNSPFSSFTMPQRRMS